MEETPITMPAAPAPKQKKEKKQRKPMKKWLKRTITIVVIAAVLVGAVFGYSMFSKQNSSAVHNVAMITRGDISVVVNGTGTIEPIDQYQVTSLVQGEILSSPFELGDKVTKGDLLYSIDAKDVQNSIDQAELSLEKAQITQQQSLDSLTKLNVTSNHAGMVTTVYVHNGDSINAGSKIADVVDHDNLTILVPFLADDATNIFAGEAAALTLSNSGSQVYGAVSRVSAGTYASEYNVQVRDVEISLRNPGSIAKGDQATAMVGDFACNSHGFVIL